MEDNCAGRLAGLTKRIQLGILLAFLAIGAGAGMLRADDSFLWRSWGVADGFTESYSRTASITPGGTPTSGTARFLSMSLFDGYGIARIPDPRSNTQTNWTSTKRVYAAIGGTLWNTSLDSLREYRDGE